MKGLRLSHLVWKCTYKQALWQGEFRTQNINIHYLAFHRSLCYVTEHCFNFPKAKRTIRPVHMKPETVLGTVLERCRNGSMPVWTAKVFSEPFQLRTVKDVFSQRLWAWLRSWITTFFCVWTQLSLELLQWTGSSTINSFESRNVRKWLP